MWINLDDSQLEKVKKAVSYIAEEFQRPEFQVFLEEIEAAHQKVRDSEGSPHRAAAQERANDNLEIDDDAIVSPGDDPGCWVHAWIWVSDAKAGIFHCEECGGSFATHMRGHGDCDVCESCYRADDDEPELCDTCNEPLDEAGDGYNGECADCADRTAAKENADA